MSPDDDAHAASDYAEALDRVVEAELGDGPGIDRHNPAVNDLQRAYLALRETPAGRAAIETFVGDRRPKVDLWASTHCLAWNSVAARTRLAELAGGDGPGAFEAKMTLRELEAGRLNLDWVPH